MARAISEIVEDIKDILNIAARTEEFPGESLTELDEFVNEILASEDAQKQQGANQRFGRLWEVIYNNGDVLQFRGVLNAENGMCYLYNVDCELAFMIPQSSIHHIRVI